MNSAAAHGPRHQRYSARHQARLDAETFAKIEELARTFHRTRSAILRYVLGWSLTQTQVWTVDTAVPVTVRTVALLVEPDLLQQVRDFAAAHGGTVAAWVRHALRQVTTEAFPESWRARLTDVRSHDSRYYGQRFMLRLDETTTQKLQQLVEQFGMLRAEIIRQLIAQAK